MFDDDLDSPAGRYEPPIVSLVRELVAAVRAPGQTSVPRPASVGRPSISTHLLLDEIAILLPESIALGS